MPRIPVRVEPYSSPSRQHRHYKNKRDQVLRALGKAAYINGSHFAIMWVSARGDVETYASEALQSRLDHWFVKGGIADEAKELVRGSAGKSCDPPVFEDSDDDDQDDDGRHSGDLSADSDPFLDTSSSTRTASKRGARPLAPLNTSVANQHFLRSRGSLMDAIDDLTVPKSAPLFPTSSGFGDDLPRSSTPLATSSRMANRASISGPTSTSSIAPNANQPSVEITLSDQAARTAFLELRFGQLQQGVCKTVAKAWIKIIEPKKQTRCPYNRGEEGKPDWWPAGVRHKEPDHLMKPERHALLLTILRSPKIQVARLQLATAEVVALIKADKVSLLMDVYRIAREEEKIRESGLPVDTSLTVAVSTLDGWCSSDNAPTTQGLHIARSVSPEPTEKKKRSAPAMSKANSTSTILPNKRRSIAAPSELRHLRSSDHGLGLMPNLTRPHSLHPSLARASSLSGPTPSSVSACTSLDGSPWQQSYPTFSEVNGLVTPITGSASIDPAFNTMANASLDDRNCQGQNMVPHHGAFFYPQQDFYEHSTFQHQHQQHHQQQQQAPPPAAHHFPQHPAFAEGNALGLNLPEGWNFDLDMPDLSHSSWPANDSFSFDSMPAPRTPSPQSNLRLMLQNHDMRIAKQPHHQQHQQQMPTEMWLSNSTTVPQQPNWNQSGDVPQEQSSSQQLPSASQH